MIIVVSWSLGRSTGFAGGDSFGALEVADVADDGIDLFGCDVGDGWHVAEVPMMSGHTVVDGVTERKVGVVADLV